MRRTTFLPAGAARARRQVPEAVRAWAQPGSRARQPRASAVVEAGPREEAPAQVRAALEPAVPVAQELVRVPVPVQVRVEERVAPVPAAEAEPRDSLRRAAWPNRVTHLSGSGSRRVSTPSSFACFAPFRTRTRTRRSCLRPPPYGRTGRRARLLVPAVAGPMLPACFGMDFFVLRHGRAKCAQCLAYRPNCRSDLLGNRKKSQIDEPPMPVRARCQPPELL
jgi:hypothetical protein